MRNLAPASCFFFRWFKSDSMLKLSKCFSGYFQVLDSLGRLNPDFISVTYGAGGSRFGKTVEIASYIQGACQGQIRMLLP